MSAISTSHSIVEFDSKTSKAFEGQRLAKVGYKTSKTGKKSQCVSVPKIPMSDITVELLQAFKPHIVAMLEQAQDGIIKELYEAGAKSVADEQISISACIQYIDSESKGERLTKESVVEWFNASLSDTLMLAFAEKLCIPDTPTPEQSKQVEAIVTTYREKFASLSGSKTWYDVETCKKLEKALEFADADDVMVARFQKKLTSMQEQKQPTIEMLGL